MTGAGWIPEDEWQQIQATVPVACVDVLVWRRVGGAGQRDVGLILRDTPHQGPRWCLVGGRVLLDESLDAAVRRQLLDTLATGPVDVDDQPAFVAEYARGTGPGPHDPRKHAIGMTWAVQLAGTPSPRHEALDFRWFPESALPELGFGQGRVAAAVLRGLIL